VGSEMCIRDSLTQLKANKTQFQKRPKMNVTKALTTDYENKPPHSRAENKPNQTQFRALPLSTCRDLAHLGWLYLNKGNWKGKQIVSEQFIAEATSPSFPNANSAYGYFWWLNTDDLSRKWHRPVFNGTGKMVKSAPANMYMATGYYGQLIYVIPDLNMVVTTMGRTEDFETLRTIRKIWAALEPTLANK